jgi:hypothetical protein
MSGYCQNPTAQSKVKITSIHKLLCRFQDHYEVMKVKFMVDCTSMKVCYHKSNFSSVAQNNLLLATPSNISSSFPLILFYSRPPIKSYATYTAVSTQLFSAALTTPNCTAFFLLLVCRLP